MPRSCGSPPQSPVMVRTRRHVGTRVPLNQRRTTDGETCSARAISATSSPWRLRTAAR